MPTKGEGLACGDPQLYKLARVGGAIRTRKPGHNSAYFYALPTLEPNE